MTEAHVHDESCQPQPGAVLCIIPGPSKLLKQVDAGVRWCFKCRQHLPHTDDLMGDEMPSYYDPIWIRRCSRCGGDHSLFPGREWIDDDAWWHPKERDRE